MCHGLWDRVRVDGSWGVNRRENVVGACLTPPLFFSLFLVLLEATQPWYGCKYHLEPSLLCVSPRIRSLWRPGLSLVVLDRCATGWLQGIDGPDVTRQPLFIHH